MNYVDGFVIPLSSDRIDAYREVASKAAAIWMELGALEYRECIGDDLDAERTISFLDLAKAKPGETVVFAWITYASKEDRDRINAQVMEDPRMKDMMDSVPFECSRMACGGFRSLVWH